LRQIYDGGYDDHRREVVLAHHRDPPQRHNNRGLAVESQGKNLLPSYYAAKIISLSVFCQQGVACCVLCAVCWCVVRGGFENIERKVQLQ
jgi:hypothetical protein